MIKNSSDYLLVNGLYVPAIKVCYDDYVSNDTFVEKGTVQSIDSLNNTLYIDTILGRQYYLETDTVLTKKSYDFSEDLYEVSQVKDLNISDYILLMKSSSIYNDCRSSTVFNLEPYLYEGSYDISVISKKLCSDIGVTKSFLIQSLRVGVPDNDLFNYKLSTYLQLNGYNTIAEFKEDLFKSNCRSIKKKFNVNKEFLNLVFLYLLGDYNIEEDGVLLNTSRLENPSLILNLISKWDLNYTVWNEHEIFCASSLLKELFLDAFGDLYFISQLHSKFDSYILNFLLRESFIRGTEVSLMYIKYFLYNQGVLATLEEFGNSFVLSIIPSDSYVTLSIGYLLPITSVGSVEESLLKFNII